MTHLAAPATSPAGAPRSQPAPPPHQDGTRPLTVPPPDDYIGKAVTGGELDPTGATVTSSPDSRRPSPSENGAGANRAR